MTSRFSTLILLKEIITKGSDRKDLCMMIVKFLFRRLLMVFLMILKEISCEEFKLKFKVQGLEIQGSGVGGASLWKAAAQAATRSGLGGDLYFLFLFGCGF